MKMPVNYQFTNDRRGERQTLSLRDVESFEIMLIETLEKIDQKMEKIEV